TYDPKQKEYTLRGQFADDVERVYRGKLTGNKLVLESSAEDGLVHRLTVTRLNDKRTLVLHEERPSAQAAYRRIAEVGYTREGVSLAVEGADGPECIVTGGKGTSTIVYKGKTY